MNHTGSNNTFIGSIAGQSGTTTYLSRTGNQNTYLGYLTSANSSAYSNSTAVGYGAQITASNQVVLGTTSETVVIPGPLNTAAITTTGLVGINGSSSSYNLYVNGSIGSGAITCGGIGLTTGTINSSGTTFNLATATATTLNLGSASTTVAIPNRISVGSTSNYTVSNFFNEIRMSHGSIYHRIQEFNGILNIVNSGNSGVFLSDGGQSWGATSDIRLKKNITDISNSLQSILNIKPVTYKLKTDEESYRLRIGFIAQNVQEYFPLIINEIVDEKYETPILGITYTELIPYMVKAIQEQQIMISNLETRLSALENK